MASRGAIRAGLGSIADAIVERAKFGREQKGRDIFADLLEQNPRLLGLQEGLKQQGFGAAPRAGVATQQPRQTAQQGSQVLPGVMTPNVTQKLADILRTGGKNSVGLVSSAISMINTANTSRLEANKREMKRMFKEATFLEGLDDPETQSAAIQAQIAEGKRSGRDTTGLTELLNTPADARGPLFTKVKVLNNTFENLINERTKNLKFEREQQVGGEERDRLDRFQFLRTLPEKAVFDRDNALTAERARRQRAGLSTTFIDNILSFDDEARDDAIQRAVDRLEPEDFLKQRLGKKIEEQVAIRKETRGEQIKTMEEVRKEQTAIREEERKPTAFQSPIGKLVGDKEAATSSFGAESPQVIAIQEAIDAENKGEPASLTDVAGVRKEFTKLSGDFIKLRDAVKKVRRGGEAISAAGDLALIFNFMKILDPGSVVRESEFATAQNSAGVPDRIRNTWNRLLRGERLAPKQRADFVDRANQLFEGQRDSQVKLENSFRTLATSQGMKPEDVVVDFIGEFRPSGEGTKTVGRFKVEVE